MRIGTPIRDSGYRPRKNADLIIAESRGHHGLALFFSGSVAADILKQSPCDVLAVRIEN